MAEQTLLMVTPRFPPEGGGLEAYAANLTEPLRMRHGWRVVVATSGDRRGRRRREANGELTIYRLPYELQLSNTRFGVTWRRDLKAILREEQPDLINAHAPVPGLADLVAALAGPTPLVLTYHAGSMKKGRWPVDGPITLYERVICPRMLSRADWMICSSDFVRDSFLAAFRHKSSTVTPGVDAELFTPAAALPAARVLFVGGLSHADRHKGLDSLLSAMVTLCRSRPQLSLQVVGAGDDLPRYQELARSGGIGDRVTFRGRLAGSDLVEAYRASTVLALPTRNDSYPMVLLEAMACGLPVVSTRVGGIPTLVEHGRHGFLVAAGDTRSLADQVARVVDDPALAARLGRAGRDRARRSFNWDGQAARTDAIFRSVLAGQPGKADVTLSVE